MVTRYNKAVPKAGDTVRGDNWSWTYKLAEDDDFKDSSFPGCKFRVLDFHDGIDLAVNIKVTGMQKWNGFTWQSRCKIEFVGDGEPSTFTGGLLYQQDN